jgi:hypothetical protein
MLGVNEVSDAQIGEILRGQSFHTGNAPQGATSPDRVNVTGRYGRMRLRRALLAYLFQSVPAFPANTKITGMLRVRRSS